MSFVAKRLSFPYGLREASFELPPTGLVTIAGPNGAGKSTLLGILAGLRRPYQGSCQYQGREIREWSRRDLARCAAFLPQSLHMEFPFTAEEVVLMGRTPHSNAWFQSPQDRAAASQSMLITDTLELRKRDFRTLSGGERQRVMLAAALAQDPRTLLLDEPATHLDLRHQLALYELLASLGKSMLVIAVTHDLNLALQYSVRLLLLHDGILVGHGAPQDVLDARTIHKVFGVRAAIQIADGRPWITWTVGFGPRGPAGPMNDGAARGPKPAFPRTSSAK
jgi:iron complex transport system ATP-binding protein